MKAWFILLFFCGAMQAFATDIDKPVFGPRKEIAETLGDESEALKDAQFALPGVEVRRFKKSGWTIDVYFDDDFSERVIISKQDATALTDQEIATFLKPHNVKWQQANFPDRRGWYINQKRALKYAVVTKDNKALEFLRNSYFASLGRQIWLDATPPKN